MKRVVNGFWLMCIAVVFISSCNDEFSQPVDQDRIYTIYELYYNQSADETNARATFKFGNAEGTLLKLDDNASVTLLPLNAASAHELNYNAGVAIYEKTYDGLMTSGTFRFTDANGEVYTNVVELDSVNFPDSLDPIIKGEAWSVVWQGESLSEEEYLSLTFEGMDGGSNRLFYQNNGSNEFVLSAEQTAELKTGQFNLIMDRRYQPQTINAPSAGGSIIGRYRPEGRLISVVDE